MKHDMKQDKGYILGIDQGGTKTAAAVMRRDGCLVGQAVTKGAYFPAQGVGQALDPIQEAVEAALCEASASMGDIALAVAGITGVDWPGDDALMERALRERLSVGDVFACCDAVIALYSGTLRSHGAAVCAGTGMNGVLVNEEGRQFVYGDYMEERAQGGSALALRAARKVFDAELGLCGATGLTPLFLEWAEVPDVDALLHRYMTEEAFRKRLRFLVPQILAVAQRGDEAACGLLDEFAGQIVDYVAAGFRRMEMSPEREEIVLAGSVFKGAENPLTLRVIDKMERRLPGAAVLQARYEPVVGACIMGLFRLGVVPAEQEKQIRESALDFGLCCN